MGEQKEEIEKKIYRSNFCRLIGIYDEKDMSSLFLVRLSENPELVGAFRELLSNEGSELYLKTAAELSCAGTLSAAEIRKRIFDHGYLFLGYLPAETNRSIFNPGLSETITLGEEDQLIVIGED